MFTLKVKSLNDNSLCYLDKWSSWHILEYLRELSWCSNVRRDQICLDFSLVQEIHPTFWPCFTEELFNRGWNYYEVYNLLSKSILEPYFMRGDKVFQKLNWTRIDAVSTFNPFWKEVLHCGREDGLATARNIIEAVKKGVPLDKIVLYYHKEEGRRAFGGSFVDALAYALMENIDANRETFLKFFEHNPKLYVDGADLDEFAKNFQRQGGELVSWFKVKDTEQEG